MAIPGLRAVCFDAVGTLIHPDPPAAAVYARVGRRWGSRLADAEAADRFTRAFQRQEALDRASGWTVSEAREQARWRAIVADVLDDVTAAEACFQELFNHFGQPAAWRCTADAGVVLAELAARGLVLAMASNFDSRLRRVAAGLPELAPIRHLAISSEIGWRKPAAPFFAALCTQLEVPAAQILLVGDDAVNDYDGALAAGLSAVLYDPTGKVERPRTIRALSQLLAEEGPVFFPRASRRDSPAPGP